MTDRISIITDLAQFTGTGHWYRHSLARKILYTDGVKYVAEEAGAYWLLDEIVFGQAHPAIAAADFQLWRLEVDLCRSSAVLTCEEGNGKTIFTKRIGFTDFPVAEIRFYFVGNVILLPGEY